MSALSATSGNKRAPLADRRDDLYETPPEAVAALLEVEALPRRVWEPACGPGSIVRSLRTAGHDVVASDLVDYRSPDQDHHGWDFLMEQAAPDGVEAIVTNPPYKNAAAFVEVGLRVVPKVVMLLRLGFLESESRRAILDGGELARVHVFRNRLPMMHRAGWEGPRTSNPTAFAWFVWEAGRSGPTELRRLSWRPVA